MNKKELTEADIRTKFITPAIVGANGEKWDVLTQLREEIHFTKGRVIVRGKTVKRGEAKKADYLLFYKPNIPLAVVEAKDNNWNWLRGRQAKPADTIVTRIVRLLENHGVHRNQIPRFVGHGLALKDVQDNAALLAKLGTSVG